MRISSWLARIRKIFWWPMLIIGGILSIGGVYLTGRDFYFFDWPGWLWLTIGVFIFFVSITGILYQFQRQLDSVATKGQKEQISNFPRRPNYSKAQINAIREFLDRFIETGEKLSACIKPRSLDNFEEIQTEIANFYRDARIEVWKLMPEYSEFFTSRPTGLDVSKYDLWYSDTAAEGRKIDGLLLKLRRMRLQL